MQHSGARIAIVVVAVLVAAITIGLARRGHEQKVAKAESPREPAAITIDYPLDGSLFPPEFPAPTWEFRDAASDVSSWQIRVSFADGSPSLELQSTGPRLRVGKTDPRVASDNNRPPELTPEQAAGHTWTPDGKTWAAIKQHSVRGPATIVITGRRSGDAKAIASRGTVTIQTSEDPVGAPIFYRDVPLMPSANEKGVIKPLASKSVPLIAWRLRNVAEPESRVVMQGLHTCANCHSFSADGKTLGMDMDGPQNDKGLYALVNVQPKMRIGKEDLVAWSDFRGKLGSKIRVGFMSRVSPDGQHVVTTVNDPGVDQTDYQRSKNPIDLVKNYYVANFTDYRFLQVFYPTRGLLATYERGAEKLRHLPGADDPRFVHTNAVWTPDGKQLVFARAEARDPYPADAPLAKFANDPNELQVKFDLYRIPFNDGKGGKAEPVLGASENGMSNSFPKVSPDGRWIVFVKAKNGLLMRPDSELYIVPTEGGEARRMKCNTSRMNSWHSFSPNGRWLVFSSKSRSPYTQMFLTHIDAAGNDSPAILIENSTAANRAVNIPEFVNIPPETVLEIDTPAAEYAKHVDLAAEAMKNRKFDVAVNELNQALALSPGEPSVYNNLGVAQTELGKLDDAIGNYRKALELNPQFAEAHSNLGEALARQGENKGALEAFEKAVELDPEHADAQRNLGAALARAGQRDRGIAHLKKAVESKPDGVDARRDLGLALAEKGSYGEAGVQLEQAVQLSGGKDPLALFLLSRVYRDLHRLQESERTASQALAVAMEQNNAKLVQAITGR
ncbi:MAG: tetratricopeptide repeat protein [Myxococcota bacterium]|nr:tetratricopeptide repeat protein [Myxococcota bacterium]